MTTKVIAEVSSLPRDRLGLIVGRHALVQYSEEGRNGVPLRSFRVSIEPSALAAHHIFIVEKFTEKGAQQVLKQVSYPSLEDVLRL